MTVLRKRMIEDLEVRNRSPHTITSYVNALARFALHFGCSPEKLGLEDIRSYQVYLVREKHAAASSLNVTVAALRFFYCTALSKDWKIDSIPYAKVPKRLPKILNSQLC